MAKKPKVTVNVEVFDATKAYAKFLEKGIAFGLRRSGIKWEREIRKSMTKGKAVRRRGEGGKYAKSTRRETSNAGEPPAVQTGALRETIRSAVVFRAGAGVDQMVLKVGQIKGSAPYGKWLEGGSEEYNVPFEARPFVGPDSEPWKKWVDGGQLRKDLMALWKKVLNKQKNLGKGKRVK